MITPINEYSIVFSRKFGWLCTEGLRFVLSKTSRYTIAVYEIADYTFHKVRQKVSARIVIQTILAICTILGTALTVTAILQPREIDVPVPLNYIVERGYYLHIRAMRRDQIPVPQFYALMNIDRDEAPLYLMINHRPVEHYRGVNVIENVSRLLLV